ncbi:DNA-processing protein DprA [Aeromicrobium fastidiosum]|uniref:DNA-protecting protein DprA n=1 Tax=Aeromicrobium fastidiosum TaxID=52699 RepID=A0A641AMD2_9ACTN|nr:DNA-processing protein DprA [Aeromicrobium fastidiosum]KAA1376553.1 DNA-protecting protein DprA [Aeromicrobium fastidiosum]MBP2391527.1 DNA processing protein [Aeromicrobium fastidiosum]
MTRRDRLALSLVVEPGDPRLPGLLADHEPGRIVAAVRGDRPPTGVPMPAAWLERGADLDRLVEVATQRATAARLRWVCPGDRDWPDRLDDLDHVEPLQATTGAPLGLWVRGSGDLGQLAEQSVAVVGARDCTTYGAECASDLGADLADGGWTVVSGAAYGIDGCAHRGTLAMERPTVAVLACGADLDYPRSHATLLDRIADGGLVVSEQAPGQNPVKSRFLSRNRIIAALSVGTVVVEAAVRSGSLNTLHWADQLGRVTMAMPGPVTSKASGGTHAAVRAGTAVLVTSGRDVLEELGGLGAEESAEPIAPTEFDLLAPVARATLDGLDWRSARQPAEIASAVRLTTAQVRVALELLRSRGLVVQRSTGWVLDRRADTG